MKFYNCHHAILGDGLNELQNTAYSNGTLEKDTENLNKFLCGDCGKQCKDEKHYKSHRYYHKHTANGPRITCKECNIEIPEKLYSRHLKRVHEKDKAKCKNVSEIWNIGFFSKIKNSTLKYLKRHWNDFCRYDMSTLGLE